MAKRLAKKTSKRTSGPRRMSPRTAELAEDDLAAFRSRLIREIADQGLDQKTVAERSGFAPSVISRLGEGLALYNAIAMAKVLGVRVGWLVAGELPKKDGGGKLLIAPDYVLVDDGSPVGGSSELAADPSDERKSPKRRPRKPK
jgi:hypothetical protein